MNQPYGKAPEIIQEYIYVPEIFGIYILYMPIKMNDHTCIYWPSGLEFLGPSLYSYIYWNESQKTDLTNKYIYLSYECSFVKKGIPQKRPGWHADGFLTNDINYVWYSDFPTIFNTTEFKVEDEHNISMEQFEKQVDESKSFEIASYSLIRMDQFVVHKVSIPEKDGIRTFVKISISDDKYNLEGNTKNPLINYDWQMYPRDLVRNHPQIKEVDSVPEGFKT